MLAVAFGVMWAGYTVTTWGYCVLKGWNITLAEWADPLHPWEWDATTAAEPPKIPATQVWPSKSAKAVTTPAQAA